MAGGDVPKWFNMYFGLCKDMTSVTNASIGNCDSTNDPGDKLPYLKVVTGTYYKAQVEKGDLGEISYGIQKYETGFAGG